MNPVERKARNKEITTLYLFGTVLRDIGSKFGLTGEGIRQILIKDGVDIESGGNRKAAELRRINRKARKDIYSMKKWGCEHSKYLSLRHDPTNPTYKYQAQKRNARVRNIPWKLTLGEWWNIWQASGKWSKYGRTKGCYCMCRYEDKGNYEKGNVKISTFVSNSKDAIAVAQSRCKPKTSAYKIIKSAGGPACVARFLGMSTGYMSAIGNNGYFPVSWSNDGRLESLAALTCGAYTNKEIISVAVRAA